MNLRGDENPMMVFLIWLPNGNVYIRMAVAIYAYADANDEW